MKKILTALAVCLALASFLTSCAPPAPAVSLQQAQVAIAAVLFMGLDVTSALVSKPLLPYAGTNFTYDKVPNDVTYPETETVTATSYLETFTGYLLNGTVVTTSSSSADSVSVYNLTMSNSNPMFTVKSITGTLTNANGVKTGSLSFDGVSYTYAELFGP